MVVKKKGLVAVMPCTGIGQVLGSITRQAAYAVCDELRPDSTVLLCLPALVKGVQEDIDMIENGPVLLLEGCKDRCAQAALAQYDHQAGGVIYLPDVLKRHGLTVADSNRASLGPAEIKAVQALAEEAALQADRLYQEQE